MVHSQAGRSEEARPEDDGSDSDPMKLLILTQYFPPEVGAPQVRLHAIARRLNALGHEVTVVTAMPNYPYGVVFPKYRRRLIVKEVVDGVRTIRMWIYAASGRRMLPRLANYLSFTLTSILGCLMAGRFDYMLVESPPLFLGLTAFIVSRLRRRTFSLYVSDLWPASAKELRIVENRWLLRLAEHSEGFLYRSAHQIYGVTQGICDDIVSREIPRSKVWWVPNGVDTELFRRVNPKALAGIREDQVVFLYAGTHGYAQGLEVILQAAQLVRHIPTILFLLVGDGPTKAALEAQATAERLTNVKFLGAQPIEAMPQYLSMSRASIVPLRGTPLFRSARPSKILPSLACKTPVIYCGEGETATLMQEEGCGLVVPPENPSALAQAVMTLAADPVLAAQMGWNGRRLAESQYSWDTIVARLAQILDPASAS